MDKKLRVVVPKGRIFSKVSKLLSEAGVQLSGDERAYRPVASDPEIEIKIMKPQNIPRLLELGSHDVGFTGLDWIQETGADVQTIMKLNFDPVRIVAAIPENVDEAALKQKRITVATEYEKIAREYLTAKNYDFLILRTFGATEAFPPDDADMIIDNTSTGRTLDEHHLKIVDTITTSSTCFVAGRSVESDPWKKSKIERLGMLFKSILDASERVMLEMNVGKEQLEDVIRILPSMRAPTVSSLYNQDGYAVKTAVRTNEAAQLIPRLREMGATDILEYNFRKVVI